MGNILPNDFCVKKQGIQEQLLNLNALGLPDEFHGFFKEVA